MFHARPFGFLRPLCGNCSISDGRNKFGWLGCGLLDVSLGSGFSWRHPIGNNLLMYPPSTVQIGDVFFEDDVLEHILGNHFTSIQQSAETIVHGQYLLGVKTHRDLRPDRQMRLQVVQEWECLFSTWAKRFSLVMRSVHLTWTTRGGSRDFRNCQRTVQYLTSSVMIG